MSKYVGANSNNIEVTIECYGCPNKITLTLDNVDTPNIREALIANGWVFRWTEGAYSWNCPAYMCCGDYEAWKIAGKMTHKIIHFSSVYDSDT